ncbi:MAG TPA: hypothetical protein VIL30_09165 [Ramlibacter sp.]|jgi:hypothetical protein
MTYTDDLDDTASPASPRPSAPHRRRSVVPAGDVDKGGLSALQVVDEDPDLHMIKCDLAAFQREEMDALGTPDGVAHPRAARRSPARVRRARSGAQPHARVPAPPAIVVRPAGQ